MLQNTCNSPSELCCLNQSTHDVKKTSKFYLLLQIQTTLYTHGLVFQQFEIKSLLSTNCSRQNLEHEAIASCELEDSNTESITSKVHHEDENKNGMMVRYENINIRFVLYFWLNNDKYISNQGAKEEKACLNNRYVE